MVAALTREQVTRIRELLEVMNERKAVIGATTPGCQERTRVWKEYDVARIEVEAILPLATEPLG